jgi:dTDP-4-amino-4,6-dideoxygalactose transaminase
VTDPAATLLGPAERAALVASFDTAAARGGFEDPDEVPAFEREFAERIGSAYAVAVSSATVGLHLVLAAAGVGPGDEVLVPAHTFPASAHAVVHAGADPVFVDVDRKTLCVDPDRLAEAVNERTRAIMAVHIGGKPAQMTEILAVGERFGLVVVEDAAQAHGATLHGRGAGTFGVGGVFSFSPKLMTSCRGGAIVTDDPDLAERCRQLRFHGFPSARTHNDKTSPEARRFLHELPGYSAALTAWQAAVLRPQIATLPERVRVRAGNGLALAEGLAAIGGFRPVLGVSGGTSNFYMLEAFFDVQGFGGLSRDQAVTALLFEGVAVSPVAVTHMLAPENPSLLKFRSMPHPVAIAARDEGVVFGHPLQSLVLSGDRRYVAETLERVAFVRDNASRVADFLADR